MFAHIKKVKLVGSFIAILLFLAIGTCLCKAQGQRSLLGELKIEGRYISELVLCRKDGHIEKFTTPNEELDGIVKLPIGEYRLQTVFLRGGYTSGYATSLPVRDWIKVTENKLAVLKAGAPLSPAVNVRKEGNFLAMDYQLLGIGNEAYTRSDRSKPPTFAIYKGQKKIASDKFKFG
jgi:hypothetical protein